MTRQLLAIGTIVLGAAAWAPFGTAATPPRVQAKLAKEAAARPNAPFDVVVATDPGSALGIVDGALRDTEGRRLGLVSKILGIVHGAAATVTGAQLLQIADEPGVVSVTLDAPVRQDALAPATIPQQDWRAATGLTDLPPTPDAPAIAVVDSGVTPAAGLNVVASIDLSSDGNASTDDRYGHGTLVAGIAAGASAEYPGAAPNARIVSIHVIGADGSARTSDVIAAADWILRNGAIYDIRVANFSLHSAQPGSAVVDPLDLAVRNLWLTGTVVVAAAGNEGPQQMLYAPANDPFVLTVGAVGTNGTPEPDDDTPPTWSSYGYTGDGFAKPDLAAPGRMLIGPTGMGSTLARTFPERVVAPGWMWMSGTSFAAPVVSGIAARLLALHPSWTPDEVKGALLSTATPVQGGLATGAGEVDAARAAQVTAPPNPNLALDRFVSAQDGALFDGSAWLDAVASASASWASASWTSASWASASWASASWASASWASAFSQP